MPFFRDLEDELADILTHLDDDLAVARRL